MPLINSSRVLARDDERSNDDFWVKDDFAPTPVMSTYLLAFVVADFRSRKTTGHAGLKVWASWASNTTRDSRGSTLVSRSPAPKLAVYQSPPTDFQNAHILFNLNFVNILGFLPAYCLLWYLTTKCPCFENSELCTFL